MWKRHIAFISLFNFLLVNMIMAASPSINLWWGVDEPVHAFAVQVTVKEEYENTYWCTVGWHSGYLGMQSISENYFFYENKYK